MQRNCIQRQQTVGHYRSPYQRGGAIFGRSMQADYPLLYTRSRLSPMELQYLKKMNQKEGLVLPTDRRQRGGFVFKLSKDSKRGFDKWKKYIKKRFS